MNTKENKPLDVLSEFPPKQEGKTLQNGKICAFAVSLQGASHIAGGGVPCQDYSDICWLETEQILIAAIADGVGSCALSHWGSYFAVTAALAYIEKAVREKGGRGPYELTNLAEVQEILTGAFHAAQDEVEQKADEAQQAVFNFQSTLTVALYDGVHVYCCHCGDDGVVVQEQDGVVKMVTKRLKGEEASSVYPLQSGPSKWQITGTKNPAAGFVMATDGVLDAFVPVFEDYYGVNYCQGIYYPFMKPAMDGLGDSDGLAAEKTLTYYKEFLNSPDYRKRVTDDLTVVAVVSPQLLRQSGQPRFNVNIWKSVYEEHAKAVRTRLEGKTIDGGENSPVVPERTEAAQCERPARPEYLKTAAREPEEKTPKRRVSRAVCFLAGLLAGAVIAGTIAFFTGGGVASGRQGTEPVVAEESFPVTTAEPSAGRETPGGDKPVGTASVSRAGTASASQAGTASASDAGKN